MIKKLLSLILFLSSFFLTFSQSVSKEVIYQVGRFDSLLSGQYDGKTRFGSLKKRGNFGLGTFNRLDGEMVCLAGKFYKIKDDGLVYKVKGREKTPFVNLTWFSPDSVFLLEGEFNYQELQDYLDTQISSEEGYYAFRIEGLFKSITTRSVHQQSPPYPILTDVIADQVTFDYENIEGTMVGFRFPDDVDGTKVPGYHFHFISKDRKRGGHLLACQTQKLTISFDISNYVEIVKKKPAKK